MIVGSMAGLLSQEGIESEIRNDILGGGAGEIAPGETWVELWVSKDQAEVADLLIKKTSAQPEQVDWICDHCRESNPATFDICWHCGR